MMPAARQWQTKHISMATNMLSVIQEVAGSDVLYAVHAEVQ
jgi:hypothetical protein